MKALGLVFGHTTYAVAAVLAAFMGGLAIGSAYLGRWGARHARPIALYGWIELCVGVSAILSLPGLSVARGLYFSAYHFVAGSTAAQIILRLLISAVVLLVPTFLMGGTLPILTKGLSRYSSELAIRFGRLYWVNTLGAAAGALAAGFLLLPQIGLKRTVLFAGILNFVAGGLALVIAREATEQENHEPEANHSAESSGITIPHFLVFSFAVVGATAMMYEVAWTRLLATTLSSSTYAFTVMLATFLVGIGLGSLLFERWAVHGRPVNLTVFIYTQTATGFSALLFVVVLHQSPALLWNYVATAHRTYFVLLLAQFSICAMAMFPAAICFGFNFPAVTSLIAAKGATEAWRCEAVGKAYAANTMGAIVGALAAGFWLVPRFGSFRLAEMTAGANFGLAVFLLAREAPRRTFMLAANAALAATVAIAGGFGVFYNPFLANFSVVSSYNDYLNRLKLQEAADAADLLFARDGLNASISVASRGHYLAIRTNGKVDALTSDKVTQLMLGHLGAIFHSAPHKVLVIGFGSGMTISALERYPDVQRIDCVEIEPAVLQAAPYLEPLNRGALRDPRLHVTIDDARDFLFTTPEVYDLIISEPSNPWIAGVASLFTDEFYQQARAHLAPGGFLVQWVQAYSIFPRDLKMVLATVANQFPQVSVWKGQEVDLVLLAQSEPAPLSLDRLKRLWSIPQLQEDYQELSLTEPESLIAYHILDDWDLRKLIATAPINTDDLTLLEYHAPQAIFAENAGTRNMDLLINASSNLLPTSVLLPDVRAALWRAAETLDHRGEIGREASFIQMLADYGSSAETEAFLANWLLRSGNVGVAQAGFDNALRLDPSSKDALLGLARTALARKDYASAESYLGRILARDPKFVPALETYATLELSRNNLIQAATWQTKLVAADSHTPLEAFGQLIDLLVNSGQISSAEDWCAELLKRDPYNGEAHRALGVIRERQHRWEEARFHLEFVERYYPVWDPRIYAVLANVYLNLDRPEDAKSVLKKAQRIFPGDATLQRAVAATD
jgi:spermidine synthase